MHKEVEKSHRTDQEEFYQLLSYTDDVDLNEKLEKYKEIIKLFNDRELIDGIGLQGHFMEEVSGADIKKGLDAFTEFGLPVYISEYDVNIKDDNDQLNVLKDQFPVMWEHPLVQGFTFWGLGVRYVAQKRLPRSLGCPE